jgi:Ricin-type beta-trefoil lectin domain-like
MAKWSSSNHLFFACLLLVVPSSLADSNLESCGAKAPQTNQLCVALQTQRRNLLGFTGLYGDNSVDAKVKSPNSKDSNQQWLVTPNLDGSVTLQNRNSSKCLSVIGELSYWDGRRVHSTDCSSTDKQQNWLLVPAEGKETCVYRLQSNFHQRYVYPSLVLQRVYSDMRVVKAESRKANWKVVPCQFSSE